MTKSQITKELAGLRKAGYLVYTFNDHRRGTKGNNGFPDHVIITNKHIYFIEVKIGKDNIREEQETFALQLIKVIAHIEATMNKKIIYKPVQYHIVNEKSFLDLLDRITMYG